MTCEQAQHEAGTSVNPLCPFPPWRRPAAQRRPSRAPRKRLKEDASNICSRQLIYLWELASVVKLDGAVGDGVILEPHEVEVKHWRELLEHDSLLCVLQTKGPRVVLVVPVQCLGLYVVCEAFLDGLLSFDVQLDVVEGLCPRGLVVNVLATNVRDLVGKD